MNIEIERKFLLRQLPNCKWDDVLIIDQFYHKNAKNYWDRYRKLESKITKDIAYQHTIKTTISKGVNREDECFLTQENFEKNVSESFSSNRPAKYLSKIRHVVKDGDLKWEVDQFLNSTGLIIAEIEIPTLEYPLELPNFIRENLIMEVTDSKQFSNRSIAKQIEKDSKQKKSDNKKLTDLFNPKKSKN